MPRNTVSWRSRAEDSRIASVRRRSRLSKACSCWIVSRTSGSDRFETLRPSSRIRSTSLRVSVFPSMAFVPHVLSAPVRRHTPGGSASNGDRVSNSCLSSVSMVSSIAMVIYHIVYLSIYGYTAFSLISHINSTGCIDRSRPSPLPAGSLLRQGRGESDPAGNPSMQCGIRPVSGGRDEEPARHGTGPGQVERLRARLLQHRFGRRGLDPHDEIVPVNADAHIAAEEEGDPAEHFLLGDPFAARERLADSRALGFGVRHARREGNRSRGLKP